MCDISNLLIMTVEESILKVGNIIQSGYYIKEIDKEALVCLLDENKRLKERLSDRLPNGGMRIPNCKISMQPTIENDKS